MVLRGFAFSLVGLWGCACALNAQVLPCEVSSPTETSQTCTQGSSFYYDLGSLFELGELSSIINSIAGVEFTYSFSITGGDLPPGLTLSPNGVFSGTLTAAGQYSFTLSLNEKLVFDGTTLIDQSFPFPLGFVVTGYTGPALSVDPSALNLNLTQNGAAVTQSVTLSNHGSQAVPFTASATTNSGGNWLTISSSGSVASFGSAAITVTADPSHLTPGTYSGAVTVSASGQALAVAVLAVVTGGQPNIQLSQTGLRFQAVTGGSVTPPQTITALNPGAGTLQFSATASTTGGGDWLSVSTASGGSSAASAGSVTVTANPTGLQPGNYYGTIKFSATGATNSPQVASVVLNVVSPANSPGAFVAPTGLIFVASVGGSNPAAKTVSITNPSPNALSYLVTSFSNIGGNGGGATWLTATPPSGTVSATAPASVSVQPILTGLATGFYVGDLTLTITNTDPTATTPPQIFHVEILLVVLPAGSSPSAEAVSQLGLQPRATTCKPSQLLPVFTLLGTGFTAAVAWPTAIEVTVVDDCGNSLTSGSVTVSFSSGDPALSLDSLNDGRWTGTWNATHAATGVTITAQAQEVLPALTGSASIGGALQTNNSTPAVSSGGVVSAANFVANAPLAPGAFAAIFGSNLSGGLNVSTQLPLSYQLGDTSVALAGEPLPLLFTSGAQVNVVLPYDLPVNSTQQLVVQNGTAISIPQTVVIAPAQPAVFTQNGFGSGAALINVYKADGTVLPNNSPVEAGYVITLYASGLGAVKPSVAAGTQAPATPLSHTVDPVTVNIGKASGKVLFAGLAPLYAQLYQVNVQIPAGLPSGDATLTLSVSGQQSAPVTITVK